MTTPRPDDAATGAAVDVAAIRARWAKAHPGPWCRAFPNGSGWPEVWSDGKIIAYICRLSHDDGIAWHDGNAIAHAPSDISALLEEVARLRALLEAGRGG